MKLEIPDFSRARVVIVGDLMLDRYWHGSTSRISPEAPVPVVHVGETEERPGGAGNVALNINSLGAHACVLGLIGKDETGERLTRILEQAGIECRFSMLDGKPTITKLRVISRHQQLIRLDFEDGFEHEHVTSLTRELATVLPGAGAVILSDYGKGTLNQVEQLIAQARAAGKPVLIDPKGNDFRCYRGATLITPNMHEFEAVVGHCSSDRDIEERGMNLINELALEALLVTRSERGMSLLMRDHKPVHMPTRAQEVFDVTGAGDTVIATFACALAAGEAMPSAMALANLAAGVVVGKLGTATASPAELQRAMRGQSALTRGVLSEAELIEITKQAKQQGEKIVMTNGCFDILHPGHVSYLQKARAQGDRLIVAVNDDASVQRLKGKQRPINTLERRMAVLSALECVDWVVPFSEDTPERLICAVTPNLLVKGGDYKPEEVAGGKCVMQAGGEVKILEYIAGHSTSDIIQTILGGR